MTRLNKIKAFSLLFISQTVFSEVIIDNDYGYSLDIPEGFELTESSPDSTLINFKHKNMPLDFVIKIQTDYCVSSEEALSVTLNKLSANYEPDSFIWNETECSIANFTMNLDQEYYGWSLSAPVENDSYLVLLCYSPKYYSNKSEDFMISTLNSLCIDSYYYNTPGIITTYAYPKEKNQNVSVNIAGNNINAVMNSIDQEAAQFVIDMEYRILVNYGNHEKMYEAWDRYYRTIYRDNYGRIQDFAKNVYDVLYPLAEEKRPENPNIQFAQYLLSWVQTLKHVRAEDKTNSDFINIPSVLMGKGSDCDNRSMLVAAVLEYAGIDSLLLVYPEYSHAIVAANIPGAQGQTFTNPENKEEYIMGETTSKLTWGTIAKEQADKSKCFSISFDQPALLKY